ncbi:hypothetical protein CSIM01_05630 [Colletotrichum simmondsii]|uniref:FAD-binding PCMH-type domain-containing protein n=1 Tax=Colletotrichum simmondsii TaxID=703756 RepID=A0A135SRL9_9PEZI|nr:hypothetical protein CSIM01_05630 [Colletotrichum simmondsii]
MTTLKSPVSVGDVQKTPNWEDDISPLIKAPYWVTKNPEVIGQRWISEMLYWGKWDLANYDDVRKRALGIYRHLRSKSMPVTRNPDHYWPESALETFRMWANNGFPRDSNCQPTKTPIQVIPEPNDPPTSFRVRKDIMSLSREELVIYQAKLDDILGARELGSKWQNLGLLHAYWCLHYQEATFLWHRAYLRYVEELINFPIPYWNGYAKEAACATSEFAGIPPMFLEQTYQHPRGETRPNPLRFAKALDGKSKDGPGNSSTVTRNPILTQGPTAAGWKEKIELFKIYHEQISHALQQSTYTTSESAQHFGKPWANIVDFSDKQPDEDYPFRFDFDGLFEQVHDNFHGWVGNDMADNTYTAFDPIFLSYHANMDRLAGVFMDANPENQFTSRFPLQPFINNGTSVSYDDTRRWHYTTIGDMAKDTRALGYMYGEPASPDFFTIKTAEEQGIRSVASSGGQAIVLPCGLPGKKKSSFDIDSLKISGPNKLVPYVVFTEVGCTVSSYRIDVFTPGASSTCPDAMGNHSFIGQVTRLGMGRGREDSRPPNKGRCRKPSATRVLPAESFQDQLSRGDKLRIIVTDLETGKEVEEGEYMQMSGAGFSFFESGSRCTTYRDFILPQLSQLLYPILRSRSGISVLEIGPGPRSVLEGLPRDMKRKIKRYTAFEPNSLFASRLEAGLLSTEEAALPCLETSPDVRKAPFDPENSLKSLGDDKFDIIVFCHSMYGMTPKEDYICAALDLLDEQTANGRAILFHRDCPLGLTSLAPHQTSKFPTGIVRVADTDDSLDSFASFIAGFVPKSDKVLQEWRETCRAISHRDIGDLVFAAPDVMMTFSRHSTALPDLTSQLPVIVGDMHVKNREARLHYPASMIRPGDIHQVQECVRWALEHRIALTVVGGGHSGHCVWPHVVAIDMSAFNQVHVVTGEAGSLVIAGAGSKTGDIISETMAKGLTVPLGSRPSVGAGLWLQGGIGHLSRLHGLACDAIVGALVVSVNSAKILCIGHVPAQHQPIGAIHPENEEELLWAIKGAGTNFGIVISVVFAAHPAPAFLVRNWVIPLREGDEAQRKLAEFDRNIASQLPRHNSADAYLYWDIGELHLGVTMYEASTAGEVPRTPMPIPTPVATILGPEHSIEIVDSVSLFETEMYMSGMHGGHAGGKTSSFKRCLFLKDIGSAVLANALASAVRTRPSPLSYLHFLQGGGAIRDVPVSATAFGCRDWNFACVITGVWPREQDGSVAARVAVEWVYTVAETLLPLSTGVYGADLGPDPRDAALAARAFGSNGLRLARLKCLADPRRVLAYTCPLPLRPIEPGLIIVVTGDSCAGKDYCAKIWGDFFNRCGITARVASISDTIKREFSAVAGVDLDRLLSDREYKEKHRPGLTAFFHDRVRENPHLPVDNFLDVVYGAAGAGVLLITGMRDEAPVATLSHLVPNSRLIEIRISAGSGAKQLRQGFRNDEEDCDSSQEENGKRATRVRDYRPNLFFHNGIAGDDNARAFAEKRLFPFIHQDLNRLSDMVRIIPDFPCPGIDFRHVLDIAQTPGGLTLCTSLFQSHFTGIWSNVNAIISCEAGGFIFASALALQVGLPLVPIRAAGKLPPPIASVAKSVSHISSGPNILEGRRFEMDQDVIRNATSVLVVDDVFASGETCDDGG